MAAAGVAYIEIKGDFSPLNRGLRSSQTSFGRSLGQMESKSKRTFASIGRSAKLGIAAGAVGLGVGFKKSVDAAVNLGEQVNKTKVVFRGAEEDVLAFGKTSASAFGVSNRAALEAAGTFGNMLVPMGIARKEAAGMSVNMVELAADMASFNNASPEETLDAIRSGLAGESEPLRRFGVDLREAALQEFALKEGIKESVKEMTNGEKAQLAYKKIISDTGDAQGDFARTSDSLANQQRVLKAQLEDLGAAAGKVFLPAIGKAASILADFLKQMQEGVGIGGAFADTIRGIGEVIGDTFTGIGDVFGSIFGGDTSGLDEAEGKVSGLKRALEDIGKLAAPIIEAFGRIGEGFGKAFEGVDQDLAAIGRGLLAISHAVASVLGPITQRMLPGIVTAFKGFAQVLRGLIQVIAGILTLDFSRAWDGVKNIFGGQLKVLAGLMRTQTAVFREAASRLGQAISGAFRGVWEGIKALFQTGLRATVGVLKTYATAYRTAALALARTILTAFNILKDLPGKVAGYVGKIPGAIREVIGKAVDAGEAVGRAIIRGLGNALSGVGKAIVNAIKSGLGGATIIPRIKVPVPFVPDPTIGPVKIPNFAKGGKAHGWAVVGEEGPELAHFSQPTDIVSHPLSKKMAKGMGIPGFAKGTPEGNAAARSFVPAVQFLIDLMKKKFGLVVSPQGGLRPGDSDSFHSEGKAADFVGAKKFQAAAWVKSSGLYKTLLEGIHNPNLSTDSGRFVPPSFWDKGAPGTWAAHKNHMHLAAVSIASAVKKTLGGGKRPADGFGGSLKLSGGQLVQLARSVGLDNPRLMAAIAIRESGGNPRAHATAGEDSRGLWQINVAPGANTDLKNLNLYDPMVNAKAAKKVRQRQGLHAWDGNAGDYHIGLGPLPKDPGGKYDTSKVTGDKDTLLGKLEADLSLADLTKRLSDDLRVLKRLKHYWEDRLRRAKRSGISSRIKTAAEGLKGVRDQITQKKDDLDDKLTPEEELFQLGGLSVIGTRPNTFNISGLQRAFDQNELERARASLTVPAETDTSQAGTTASLQDDITAAQRLIGLWEGLNTLVNGFRLPDRPLDGPFKPNAVQKARLTKAKSNEERVSLLKSWIAEATQGPLIKGTIGQKTEAATNLASARSDLRSLMDEAGLSPTEIVNESLRAKQALAALTPGTADDIVVARENVAIQQSRLDTAKASGDNTAIADAATALKSALDELKSLTDAQGADLNSFFAGIKSIHKEFGSNLKHVFAAANVPTFHEGGTIQGPRGTEQLVKTESGEFILRRDGKNLNVVIEDDKRKRANVTQHLHFQTAPENQHIVQRFALLEAQNAA